MTSCCDNQDYNRESNSGFIFGLLCGLVIGAVVAILIYKNNKTDVFEKLSQKIKNYFDNLVKASSPKTNSSKTKVSHKRLIATSTTIPSKKEITPVFVKTKKPAPKTFLKPKK